MNFPHVAPAPEEVAIGRFPRRTARVKNCDHIVIISPPGSINSAHPDVSAAAAASPGAPSASTSRKKSTPSPSHLSSSHT